MKIEQFVGDKLAQNICQTCRIKTTETILNCHTIFRVGSHDHYDHHILSDLVFDIGKGPKKVFKKWIYFLLNSNNGGLGNNCTFFYYP